MDTIRFWVTFADFDAYLLHDMCFTVLLFRFCDTSKDEYAAVIYLRVIDAPHGCSVSIVGTKTKLVPMKALTTP